MTKFLLDSGDPNEYRKIAALAKEKGSELWGATTNRSIQTPKRKLFMNQKESFFDELSMDKL